MDNENILIQLNNASYKYPGGDYLFENVKLTVKEGDKIAVVGANGSGKSTLLKILAGIIKLEDGDQIINSRPYYVPQIDLTVQQDGLKIYEYITQYYDEWWDVLSELERLFKLELDPEAEIKILSGGELMKLNLTIAVKHNPNVLILDEPTNHLDIQSIDRLIKFINVDNKDKYTYIIVSHDIFFLDNVITSIWEIDNKNITIYGGNYSFYKEQKELHLKGLKRQYDIARAKLEKTTENEQKMLEKSERKANEAKRAFMKGSIDKRAYSVGKDAASSLQERNTLVIDKLKEKAEEILEEYETEERKLAFINMKNTEENKDRTILEIKNGVLKINKKELITKINFKVTYGDRIVISGSNGSGKTSFIKSLINKSTGGDNSPVNLDGEIYLGDRLEWVYIDQNYSLIKPQLNMIQNIMTYHKSITESKAKEQLGKFQFKTEAEMNKLGSSLSGGEMVRLIMAMITTFPIDLLIMDEPTNNLDVETIDVLTRSINNFRGAVIVISHNIDFLNKINIKTAYIIKDNKLKPMKEDPGNKEAFYKALTE